MKIPEEKPIWLILKKKNSALGALVQNKSQHNKLKTCLAKYLEPSLMSHVHVVSFKSGRLKLAVDNPHWHHHLRYKQSDLLQSLRHSGWYNLISIDVSVAPFSAPIVIDTSKPQSQRHLSQDSQKVLNDLADCCTDNDLKSAIANLSRNHTKE